MAPRQVFSSYLNWVDYDPQTRTLSVGYKTGGETSYADVPADVAAKVMSAPSIGSALHEHIRGRHAHTTRVPDGGVVSKPAERSVPEMVRQVEKRR